MQVSNIVASLSTGRTFDLFAMYEKLQPFTKYKPEKFPGMSLKLPDPEATLLFFKSGKMVCVGTNDPEITREAIETALELYDLPIELANNMKINNYVASNSVKHPIDLRKFCHKYSTAIYEPELFTGLRYKLKNCPVTIIIFHTGKFFMTGSNNLDEMNYADTTICSLIEAL